MLFLYCCQKRHEYDVSSVMAAKSIHSTTASLVLSLIRLYNTGPTVLGFATMVHQHHRSCKRDLMLFLRGADGSGLL